MRMLQRAGNRHDEAQSTRSMLVGAAIALLALLAAMVLTALAGVGSSGSRDAGTRAMSRECQHAYHAYMMATDPAEADFWAESWMTFGCETGGGYWA